VRRRAAALVGGAAVLLLAACGAPASPSAAPPPASPSAPAVVPVDVRVAGGEVQGPGARVEVPVGATVRISVVSDRADELHVHGYDRSLPLVAGTPGVLEVVADVPGVFETELHESGATLPSLEVR
jgi:hypothetical protein